MSKKIGLLLSGCGVYDGSEIHEAVLTLLAIVRNGGEAIFLAPNIEQKEVINHLTGKAMPEKRNALVEAARIARGKIKDVASVSIADVDALILPGGFGAAKTLSNYAETQEACDLHPDVDKLLKACLKAKKPLGFICIAPVVAAKAAQGLNPHLTIGNDPLTKSHLEKMGAVHEECAVQAVSVDEANRMVSTPAYMLAQNIAEAAEGIEKLVQEVFKMMDKR